MFVAFVGNALLPKRANANIKAVLSHATKKAASPYIVIAIAHKHLVKGLKLMALVGNSELAPIELFFGWK